MISPVSVAIVQRSNMEFITFIANDLIKASFGILLLIIVIYKDSNSTSGNLQNTFSATWE